MWLNANRCRCDFCGAELHEPGPHRPPLMEPVTRAADRAGWDWWNDSTLSPQKWPRKGRRRVPPPLGPAMHVRHACPACLARRPAEVAADQRRCMPWLTGAVP
jgi:hypothetical protein